MACAERSASSIAILTSASASSIAVLTFWPLGASRHRSRTLRTASSEYWRHAAVALAISFGTFLTFSESLF
jgi:hypothetical protein